MSSGIFGVFGSITGTRIALSVMNENTTLSKLWCVIPKQCHLSASGKWRHIHLFNGSIINITFNVMFENKAWRPGTKHRHGKLFCHSGIRWDMEGMLDCGP